MRTLIIILLTITTTANAQRYREYYKWEARCSNGGIVFGISENEEEAKKVYRDFQRRNENLPYYGISFSGKWWTYDHFPGDSIQKLMNRPYITISKEQVQALDEAIPGNRMHNQIIFLNASKNRSKKVAQLITRYR